VGEGDYTIRGKRVRGKTSHFPALKSTDLGALWERKGKSLGREFSVQKEENAGRSDRGLWLTMP